MQTNVSGSKSRVVEDKDLGLSVTIGQATVRMGNRRQALADEGKRLQESKEQRNGDAGLPADDVDVAEYVQLLLIYPALIASVTDHQGFETWPVSFDEFLDLPEPFVLEWDAATFELNPHWSPKMPTKEEIKKLQKKVTATTSESQSG